MRLAAKIVCVILCGVIALLSIDGYLSVEREIRTFRRDMERDSQHFGQLMQGLVTSIWSRYGSQEALAFIHQANREGQPMQLRWVTFWVEPGRGRGALPPILPKAIRRYGQGVSPDDRLVSYFPLLVDGHLHGALEISEPMTELHQYAQLLVWRSLVLVALTIIASGAMILVVGVRMVGRPLEKLMAKTRRIGSGDFAGELALHGHDELSSLAWALNQMCAQLQTARDTVRAETEARIAALEQLRHSERLSTVGRLAAGMAHELGTPLNVVSGRAKLIASGAMTGEEISGSARIIAEQAERMTTLMRQLLDFARRGTPQRRKVDFAAVASSALEMLRPTARKQQVELVLEAAEGLPKISVDPAMMQQVLINLIMNGIQAMPQGGRLEVILRETLATPAGDSPVPCLALAVRDQGEGLAEELVPRIFEPFFTTKEVGQGTGLGLSIAYGIAQEHGGWIVVESSQGQGACFTVFLPLAGSEV